MPGQLDESEAIFRWLATEVSPDTYVNIMGQYRPTYQVGEIARDGTPKYEDVARRPRPDELEAAYDAAGVPASGVSTRGGRPPPGCKHGWRREL